MIWLLTFRSWFTQPTQASVTRKLKGGFFFLPQKYLFNEFRLYKSLQAHCALASSLGNTAVVLINRRKFSVPNSSDELIFVKRWAWDGRTDGLNSWFYFFSFHLNLPKNSKLRKISFLATLVREGPFREIRTKKTTPRGSFKDEEDRARWIC